MRPTAVCIWKSHCNNWRAGASRPSRSTGTIFLFVCMSPYRNVLRNSKYTSAKFHVHRVSRMRKYISLRSSSVLQLAGLRVVGGRLALYSCSQLCVLLPCIFINNLYCNHQVLAQLLHHFLLYGSLPLANNVQHSASMYSMYMYMYHYQLCMYTTILYLLLMMESSRANITRGNP